MTSLITESIARQIQKRVIENKPLSIQEMQEVVDQLQSAEVRAQAMRLRLVWTDDEPTADVIALPDRVKTITVHKIISGSPTWTGGDAA